MSLWSKTIALLSIRFHQVLNSLCSQEADDNDYDSEDSVSDEVDSDFDIDEDDEVRSDMEDDDSKPKRKRQGVVTKAYKV